MTESIQMINAQDVGKHITDMINSNPPEWLGKDVLYSSTYNVEGISILVAMKPERNILRYNEGCDKEEILANRPYGNMHPGEIQDFACEIHEKGKKLRAKYDKYVKSSEKTFDMITEHYPARVQFEDDSQVILIDDIVPPSLIHFKTIGFKPPVIDYVNDLLQNEGLITFHVKRNMEESYSEYGHTPQIQYFKDTVLPLLTANIPENEFDNRIKFTSNNPIPAIKLRDEVRYLYKEKEILETKKQ